jgi:uncharacterized protein YbcI
MNPGPPEVPCRPPLLRAPTGASHTFEIAMKTRGEIEDAICERMARFEQEYMGREPKDIHAHLIGDLLVVRLQGALTAAERQLVQTLPSKKGRDLLKGVRTQLIETARPVLEAMVQKATGSKMQEYHAGWEISRRLTSYFVSLGGSGRRSRRLLVSRIVNINPDGCSVEQFDGCTV